MRQETSTLNAIVAEIKRQQKASQTEHGAVYKRLSQLEWINRVVIFAGRAKDNVFKNSEEQQFRKSMVKVAALAISAIHAHDKGYC